LQQAQALIQEHGETLARALVPILVQITRREWPECRSLSGAVQKYLPDALKLYHQQQSRAAGKREAELRKQQELRREASRQDTERELHDLWERLPEAEQQAIRQAVLERLGSTVAPEAFLQRLCLEEVARRQGLASASRGPEARPDRPPPAGSAESD
jgi:hypothetical protein